MKKINLSDYTEISRLMYSYLKKGKKELKNHVGKKISPGRLLPLIDKEFKNGSKIQVDLIFDMRLFEYPFVAVHYFKPSKNLGARSADYVMDNKDEVFGEQNKDKHIVVKIGKNKFVAIYKRFDKNNFEQGYPPHEVIVPSVGFYSLKTDTIICSLKEIASFKNSSL